MPNQKQWAAARARQRLYASVRSSLQSLGYLEVETPALVVAPGMEPHIAAFEVPFVPQTGVGAPQTLYLHTSPEYAMKRLLADKCGPVFQICKVFRNGEVSLAHNPEFTMLELYRPNADYRQVMEDLEEALAAAEEAQQPPERLFRCRPYERLTVAEAFARYACLDLAGCPDATSLRAAAEKIGVRTPENEGFEDVFFRIFLEKVEGQLGRERPAYLIDYPASMAALARLKPQDPSLAERFELYARGVELANGYSELTDPSEQRRRLVAEQEQRRRASRPVYSLDESFLDALARMPPSAGVAVGLDRVLMLLVAAQSIEEVLLFPAAKFLR
jgi:lysyl-tRNA synthetase class 2